MKTWLRWWMRKMILWWLCMQRLSRMSVVMVMSILTIDLSPYTDQWTLDRWTWNKNGHKTGHSLSRYSDGYLLLQQFYSWTLLVASLTIHDHHELHLASSIYLLKWVELLQVRIYLHQIIPRKFGRCHVKRLVNKIYFKTVISLWLVVCYFQNGRMRVMRLSIWFYWWWNMHRE